MNENHDIEVLLNSVAHENCLKNVVEKIRSLLLNEDFGEFHRVDLPKNSDELVDLYRVRLELNEKQAEDRLIGMKETILSFDDNPFERLVVLNSSSATHQISLFVKETTQVVGAIISNANSKPKVD